MTFVKRLVMQGFKSFVKKTELPFTTGINVVLGPNGSGKSNVSDALCFVLGRLSVKSMRAAKARNLIFLGTKAVGPAKEATVEIVFDKQGRMLIPQFLKDFAAIKRDVMIVGVSNRIEIWAKDRWQEFYSNNQPVFEDIAEQLMENQS